MKILYGLILILILANCKSSCKGAYTEEKTTPKEDTSTKSKPMAAVIRQDDINKIITKNDQQDTKLSILTGDVTNLKTSLTRLTADTLAKGKLIRGIQDTLKSYRSLVRTLNGVQFVADKNGVISVPDLTLIKAAMIKAGLLK